MEHFTTWRKQAGMTQVTCAQSLGVAQSTISKLEAGEIMPGRSLAVRIARLTRGAVPVEIWDAGHDVSHGPAPAPDQEAAGQ